MVGRGAPASLLAVTRIAILADIHGNIPALEAVIGDIADQRPDLVLVGGDLVGRGPEGSAVAERIRGLGWPCIQGNHESFLLSLRRDDPLREGQTWADLACHRWMAQELTEEDARFIAGLPRDLPVEVGAGLRVVHGSPSSFHEGLGSWTPDEVLRGHLDTIPEPALVCAHTHRPFARHLGEQLVVNVGSVGLSFDGDWRARYAVLSTDGEMWEVEHRTLEWDRDRFLAIYRSSGFMDAGGVTARLLEMEVHTARSHLVPFVVWTRETGQELDWSEYDEFALLFDPELGIDELLARDDGQPARAANAG